MSSRGIGDRWLKGELPAGVGFAMNDRVEIRGGPYAGEAGTVVLLLGLSPEPQYLVALGGGQDVRVGQSALAAA